MQSKFRSQERKLKHIIQECIWLTAAANGHGVRSATKAPRYRQHRYQLLCLGWAWLVSSYSITFCARVDTATLCQVIFALRTEFWMKESSDVGTHHLKHWHLHVLSWMHLASICQPPKLTMILIYYANWSSVITSFSTSGFLKAINHMV